MNGLSDQRPIRFVARADVAASPLGEELALLDLTTGEYYTLNGTGSFLWSELAAPKTKDELLARMLSEFEIEEDVARTELSNYIRTLLDSGLVQDVDA